MESFIVSSEICAASAEELSSTQLHSDIYLQWVDARNCIPRTDVDTPHPDNDENARLSYAIRQIVFARPRIRVHSHIHIHRIDMQNVCYGARLMSELRLPAIYLALAELSCICELALAACRFAFAVWCFGARRVRRLPFGVAVASAGL